VWLQTGFAKITSYAEARSYRRVRLNSNLDLVVKLRAFGEVLRLISQSKQGRKSI
jgi:hypothetical protein